MDSNSPKKLHQQPTIVTNFKNQQTIKDENGWEDQKIDPNKNRGNRQGRGNRNQENETHSGRRMISYENEHEDADSNFEGNNDSDNSNDQKEKDNLSFSQVEQSKIKEKEEKKQEKNEVRTNEYEEILKDLREEKDVGVGNGNGSDKKEENRKVKETEFENEDDEMDNSWFQDSEQGDSKKVQNTSLSLIEKEIKSDHQDINTTLTVNPPKNTHKNEEPNESAQRGNRANREFESDFKKKTFYQDSDQNYQSNQNYRENREGPRDYLDNHPKRYYGDSYEMGRGGRGGRGEGRGEGRGGIRGGRGGRGGRGTNMREREEYTNSFRENRERQLNQNEDYSNGPRHNNFNGYREQTNFRDNGNRQNDYRANRDNRDNGFREEHVPRNYNNGKYNESDRISNRNNRDEPENYPKNNREETSNFDRNYERNNNRPIRNTHHESEESKQKEKEANKIKDTQNLKEVALKEPNKELSIEPRGQKCWPEVSIYIQSTKLTFGYRQITEYECDVIIIPYKNESFDIYPGNIMNRCSVDYREKIRNKGEEIAKIGSLYAQKCVGIPNFKIFGFLKIGTGNMKESLSQIIPQLKKIKANFQTVLIPFSKDMGKPKEFIETIAESINGNRGFTEIHLSTNNAKEYREGFKSFCEFIDQLIEQNKICIDF